MTRRGLLGLFAGAALGEAPQPPAAPVAIARAARYDSSLDEIVERLFDQLGGLGRLVKGKTVTIKLNLTGSPASRFEGRPPGVTHYVHPRVVGAVVQAMGRAGARRIRLVESCWATGGPMEEFLLDAGWPVRALATAAPGVEFENTNNAGKAGRYARLKAAAWAWIYPAYDVNAAYQQTDVFVSLAKLKNHGTCGVTLSLKNCFGITPASIYGDDAGRDDPNENSTKGRSEVFHFGRRPPSRGAPRELDPSSSRDPGYRVPRITAELVSARPVDLALIDGIQTVTGGEGPWIKGLKFVEPGLLIAG
ncbi:MAG: DUF362 domain-containing protein, partial [Bryobacteraceae bacterium]